MVAPATWMVGGGSLSLPRVLLAARGHRRGAARARPHTSAAGATHQFLRPPAASGMADFPRHLCLAQALYTYTGDGSSTGSVIAGRSVLVQGDRTDAPDGWVYGLIDGLRP